MRILIVEGDDKTAAYWAGGLEEEGHLVNRASNGLDGLFCSIADKFDLLIIDQVLPDLDGDTLVQALRVIQIDTPVLSVNALSATVERAAGANTGHDNELVKALTFSELAVRVKLLTLHLPENSTQTVFKIADLELDLSKHLVKRAGILIKLQPREFRLLEYLMRHAGQVVSRNTLLKNVWKHHHQLHTKIVKPHLSKLRAKVDRGFARELIHIIPGVGYCLREPD